jgi:hypothetical protein
MANENAIVAILMDHFKLTKDEIGKLTDREIAEQYFHKREKDGAIKPMQTADEPDKLRPQKAKTLIEHLLAIDQLVWNKLLKPDKAKELKDKLRSKWQTRAKQ